MAEGTQLGLFDNGDDNNLSSLSGEVREIGDKLSKLTTKINSIDSLGGKLAENTSNLKSFEKAVAGNSYKILHEIKNINQEVSNHIQSLNNNVTGLYQVIQGLGKKLNNTTHSTKTSSTKQSTKASSTKPKIINKTDLTPSELSESLMDSLFEGLVKGEQEASSFIKQINTSRNKIKGELSQKTIKNEKEAEQKAKETEKQAKQYAENVMQGYITPHLALPYNPNVKPTLSNNEGGYAKPIGYKNEIEGQNKKSKSVKQKINRAKELEKGGMLPSDKTVIVGGEILSNTTFKEFRSKSKQEDKEAEQRRKRENKEAEQKEKQSKKESAQKEKEEKNRQKQLSKGILPFLPGGGGMNNISKMFGKGNPVIAGILVAVTGLWKTLDKALGIGQALNDLLNIILYSIINKTMDFGGHISGLLKKDNTNSTEPLKETKIGDKVLKTYSDKGTGINKINISDLGIKTKGRQYTALESMRNVQLANEMARKYGLTMEVTAGMEKGHAESSDPSKATHGRGQKMDVKFRNKSGKVVTLSKDYAELYKEYQNLGFIGAGAVGEEVAGSKWRKDKGKDTIYDFSVNQEVRKMMGNYEKYNLLNQQKEELDKKQKEIEKQSSVVDIYGNTQTDTSKSILNTMPYLDSSPSPTVSEGMKDSIMGVYNTYGNVFGY